MRPRSPRRPEADALESPLPRRSKRPRASRPAPSPRSRCLGSTPFSSTGASSRSRSSGWAAVPSGISSGSRPPSSAASRKHGPWTSSPSPPTISRNPRSTDSMQETDKIWMNGELVDWNDARIHVGSHGLHYGSGVFEGIRCYDTPKGPAVFRLGEHLRRLESSAKVLWMDLPYTQDELRTAVHELV